MPPRALRIFGAFSSENWLGNWALLICCICVCINNISKISHLLWPRIPLRLIKSKLVRARPSIAFASVCFVSIMILLSVERNLLAVSGRVIYCIEFWSSHIRGHTTDKSATHTMLLTKIAQLNALERLASY